VQESPETAAQELANAREIIARQAEEIARLQRDHASSEFADELREAVRLAVTAGTIAAPTSHTRLLELIVDTAAHVIRARAGALFLVDDRTRELVFEVALGQKADVARRFRVPMGHGIAGLVAATGQPLAISDAQRDSRHATDIAQSVGYLPETILCVPLLSNENVIGVLELLDKDGSEPFGSSDMAVLSRFADQAAVAIQQSQNQRKVDALLAEVLASMGSVDEGRARVLQEQLAVFASDIEHDTVYERALELAQLVRDIARQGEPALQMCQTVLAAIARYARDHASAGFSLERLR
jgi:GAF domain-containing protein